ncbi:Protein CBG10995, partial [Caenorhabditis briggsae]
MTNIRIGVFPLEKDAQTCFEVPTCKNPGAEVEVLQLAFRLIGVNYTIVDVWKEFGQLYDFGAKQADGSWSGMIGLLQTGQLDMIGLSMRMSSEREEAVLFSYPTRVFETTISSFIVSSRVLLVVTLFTTFMLSQLYQTDMYAFLSAPLTYDIPFRTIKQALDVVDKKKMFFAAFENQSFLCTPNICNRYEQVIKKNPVKRGDTSDDVESLILKGGIYQSTIDSALLPGTLSWLNPGRSPKQYLVIRDEDAPSYYVAYTFAKKHKKLIRKFNNALIEVLPAVSLITTGHGYNTKKTPMVHICNSILIFLSVFSSCIIAHPHKTSVKDLEKDRMLTTNEYYVEKVNQMAGISCDLCMRAVYGVNYDFIQLKKDVIEMIRLDCEALFHDRAEDISECIRFLTTKVEKYSGKVS